MRSFAEAGIADVVLSPGSRSTPFLIAALRESRFRCHDVIDERAAAFFALGQARWSGRPSLVLCTSGTAAAHYYPAIVEASLARVPLVVVTADRPFELQECGAPQTIDQTKLYGGYVRQFFEAGMPDAALGSLRALQRMAAQASFAAQWPDPGPVHMNVRARKPLEPRAPRTDEEKALARTVRDMRPAVVASAPRMHPDPGAIAAVIRQCRDAHAGLIVSGPMPIAGAQHMRRAVLRLAAATHFPLLAEVTSQLRLMPDESRQDASGSANEPLVCDAFHMMLEAKPFRETHVPDLIVQIGANPTSASWERYASLHGSTPRVVVAAHGWNDSLNTASTMLFGDVVEITNAIASGIDARPHEALHAWRRRFSDANRLAQRTLDAELDLGTDPLTETRAVRGVLARLPAQSVLMLGNSLPLRHVEALARRGEVDARVACQRGANGIDGLIAGTLGTAAASGRPTTLIVGDISFLHDLNSLMLGRAVAAPVVLVVLNNRGGRIFEQLPIATEAREHEVGPDELAHVTTPHALTFGPAAQMFGLPYHCVDSSRTLDAALASAYATQVCTVIECNVPGEGVP